MPRSYDSGEAVRRWDLHAHHIVPYMDLDVIEPKPAGEMLTQHPRFCDDLRMSHFIVFRAQKP